MDVWDHGVMEKHLAAAQADQGRDDVARLLLLIPNGRVDTAPLATHVLTGWDEVADSLELMRSRHQSAVKPIVVIDRLATGDGAAGSSRKITPEDSRAQIQTRPVV